MRAAPAPWRTSALVLLALGAGIGLNATTGLLIPAAYRDAVGTAAAAAMVGADRDLVRATVALADVSALLGLCVALLLGLAEAGIGVALFRSWSWARIAGMVVALIGAAWYAQYLFSYILVPADLVPPQPLFGGLPHAVGVGASSVAVLMVVVASGFALVDLARRRERSQLG